MRMFEDGPPPLPRRASTESSSDTAAVADLDDENRLTAVADEDGGEVAGNLRMTFFSEQDLSLREFVDVDAQQQQQQPLCLVSPTKAGVCSCNAQSPVEPPPPQRGEHADEVVPPEGLPISECRAPGSGISACCLDEYAAEAVVEQAPDQQQQQQQQQLCTSKTASPETSLFQDLSESVAVEGESRQATGGGGDILDASVVGADEAVQGSADALSVEGTAPANGSERCEKEEEDEFGDFEECVAIERNANSSWANFETVGIEKHITSGDQSSPLEEELAELRLPSLEANSSGSSTESALANCFVSDQLWVNDSDRGDVIEENDEQAFSGAGIYESLNGTEKTNSSNAGPDKLVWLAVSIIEEALALKLQWQESTVRKDFLESLNIDANRAVVRKSGLPVFAQQLEDSSVLAPVSAMGIRSRLASVSSKNLLSQSNSAEFLPRISVEKITTCQQPPPRSVTVDSLAVPPAQFDWSNSGLTNPLKAGSISASSAILDLDFLAAANSRSGAAVGGFASDMQDLAAFGLNSSDDSKQNNTQLDALNTGPAIMESFTNKKGKTSKSYTAVNELSLDARALHDQLPDLDYMLSNVLLFPIVNR